MPPDKRDEFQTIGLALDSLLNLSDTLSKENEENKKFKSTHHFRQLAEGRTESITREMRKEAEQSGLPLESGPTLAAIVEIDRFLASVCRRYSEHDRQLLTYALQSALQETMSAAGVSVWLDWLAEHQLGLIAAYGGKKSAELEIEAALDSFRIWTERHLPFTVTIGIGISVDRIDTVSRSFKTAREALAYKVPLGLNRVIAFRHLPEDGHPEIVQELQRIKEISRSFRMGEAGWTGEWALLLSSIRNGKFSGEQIRHMLFILLFQVQREMIGLPDELQSVWLKESARLEEALKEGETLSDIDETFTSVLESVWEQLCKWRESKSNRSVLQEIKRYIDGHYSDPNLSLVMLANEFHINPASISRLFKEEFGVKFIDYLNNVRIEQAIRLMQSSDLLVQDIAEQVGFVHSQTFIKMFKKITGSTPGLYRKEKTGGGLTGEL
jgi:AraC-like DNA-binding protein